MALTSPAGPFIFLDAFDRHLQGLLRSYRKAPGIGLFAVICHPPSILKPMWIGHCSLLPLRISLHEPSFFSKRLRSARVCTFFFFFSYTFLRWSRCRLKFGNSVKKEKDCRIRTRGLPATRDKSARPQDQTRQNLQPTTSSARLPSLLPLFFCALLQLLVACCVSHPMVALRLPEEAV